MFLPGVLKENSGGGLVGFAGVEVTGLMPSGSLAADTGVRLALSSGFSMLLGIDDVTNDGRTQSSLKI